MRSLARLVHRLAVLLFWPAVVIVAWGELTPVPLRLEVHVWDKLLHFAAYFGLAALAALSLRSRRTLMFAMLGLMAFGGALEVLQGLTGRDSDWLDEVANMLGVILGAGSGLLFLRLVDRTSRD